MPVKQQRDQSGSFGTGTVQLVAVAAALLVTYPPVRVVTGTTA